MHAFGPRIRGRIDLFAARARRARLPRIAALPRVLRIVLESLLRNCDGERVLESRRRGTCELAAARQAHVRDSVRRRPHRAAGRRRHSVAVRPRGDARRHGRARRRSLRRSSRTFRSTWSSTTRCRSITTHRATRWPEHAHRGRAQSRAIQLRQMGDGRDRRRSPGPAGLRHPASGESRVSLAGTDAQRR